MVLPTDCFLDGFGDVLTYSHTPTHPIPPSCGPSGRVITIILLSLRNNNRPFPEYQILKHGLKPEPPRLKLSQNTILIPEGLADKDKVNAPFLLLVCKNHAFPDHTGSTIGFHSPGILKREDIFPDPV